MSLFKSTNPIARQAGIIAGTVLLSVVLSLSILHTFPQIIPAYRAVGNSTTIESAPIEATPSAIAPLNPERSFVAVAVERVGPAVVRIDTERTITAPPNPFFSDPFFRDFFGRDVFPQLPQEYHQRGQGSGFITDRNGLILTNAHVVSGADAVVVTLRDGRTFKGKVQGVDEPSDLAVVKIGGANLPVAPLGSSADVQVGDWAIAVGNPFGLDNTVTMGIVSTLNRASSQVGIPDKRLDFLQTDAAINPGNSGGPLLNQRGEVIGINTAIRADAQGIGFAIPIDNAKQIKDRLACGERISHPYIGIRMLTLTPVVAKQLNQDPNSPMKVPEISGVLIVQVVPNSPAATGGLRRGDVITEANGQAIKTAQQLQDTVEATQIGQPLRMRTRRGELTQELTVRPAELQEASR
jgi:S1-C subfamily serine protease